MAAARTEGRKDIGMSSLNGDLGRMARHRLCVAMAVQFGDCGRP
jgi:hypothetical protein